MHSRPKGHASAGARRRSHSVVWVAEFVGVTGDCCAAMSEKPAHPWDIKCCAGPSVAAGLVNDAPTHQRTARVFALHMGRELVDERGGMARQQTPRISRQHGPAADRSVAVQKRYGAQAVTRHGHR